MFQNVQQIQDFIRQNGIAFLDFKMIDLRGQVEAPVHPAARFNDDIMTHGASASTARTTAMPRLSAVTWSSCRTSRRRSSTVRQGADAHDDRRCHGHRPSGQTAVRTSIRCNVAKSAIAHMQALGVADEMIIGPEYEFHVFDGMTRTLRPGCRSATACSAASPSGPPENSRTTAFTPARTMVPRQSARRPHV